MSRIITKLTCKKCKVQLEGYITFGHPEEDFEWTWECLKCNAVNEEIIKAMPDPEFKGVVMVFEKFKIKE